MSNSTPQDVFFKTTLCKFVKKRTSCAVELGIKWRVVVQDCQQESNSIRKVVLKKTSCDVELVELDVKWRVVVQHCQQEGDSIHNVVLKKTSCGVELDTKWRDDVQKSSWRGCLNTQSCLEKDVFWRWTRRKVTSRGARLSPRGRLNMQSCREKRRLVTLN